jgi:addiction module HigA family antidote
METPSTLRSPTITEGANMATRRLEPIHPGEILEEDFMRPLGLSANALAKRIDVPVTRISEMMRGRRGITADTALRLARFFGTSPELWLGLQAEYDLRVARREVGDSVESRIVPLKRAAGEYDQSASDQRRQVGERLAGYRAPAAARSTRDRRRIRRSS